MTTPDAPEPCTYEAREEGCSCHLPFPGPTDIDPPEPRVDPWCPLHGWRDPDRERDAEIDDELTGQGHWHQGDFDDAP